ncbi:MAG TPA: hypothetical protein VE090_02895 [Methylomirabilota bacterium]|nr:hypothetical protein [Methylomirabilota bacterium]
MTNANKILKGAVVAAAGAALAHKDTRKKIFKGVKQVMNTVQEKAQKAGKEAEEHYKKIEKKNDLVETLPQK